MAAVAETRHNKRNCPPYLQSGKGKKMATKGRKGVSFAFKGESLQMFKTVDSGQVISWF